MTFVDGDEAFMMGGHGGKDETQKQLVSDLMERAFGGSAQRLVMQALASKRSTPEELDAIRGLIDHSTQPGSCTSSAGAITSPSRNVHRRRANLPLEKTGKMRSRAIFDEDRRGA